MTQTPSRDWQKDMNFILCEKERVQIFHLDTKEEDIAIHWLQEAKELHDLFEEEKVAHTKILEREKRMKEEIEATIPLIEAAGLNSRAASLKSLLATIYPDTPKGVGQDGRTLDTPAPKEGDNQ